MRKPVLPIHLRDSAHEGCGQFLPDLSGTTVSIRLEDEREEIHFEKEHKDYFQQPYTQIELDNQQLC